MIEILGKILIFESLEIFTDLKVLVLINFVITAK